MQNYDDGARQDQGWSNSLDGVSSASNRQLRPAGALTIETVSAANVEDAMAVIKRCFSLPNDIGSARGAYDRFISGQCVYESPFSETTVELISYSLYRVDGQPAAVSGAYKLLSEPDRIYMGWLGVSPEFRKSNSPGVQPISELILQDTIALARERGATAIAAVAEDAASNQNTHRYYERHGFKIERVFERNGETDRLYVLEIAPGPTVQ